MIVYEPTYGVEVPFRKLSVGEGCAEKARIE